MIFMLVPFLEARIKHKWTNGRSSDLSFISMNIPSQIIEWRLDSRASNSVVYFVILSDDFSLEKSYSSGTVQDFHLIPS